MIRLSRNFVRMTNDAKVTIITIHPSNIYCNDLKISCFKVNEMIWTNGSTINANI